MGNCKVISPKPTLVRGLSNIRNDNMTTRPLGSFSPTPTILDTNENAFEKTRRLKPEHFFVVSRWIAKSVARCEIISDISDPYRNLRIITHAHNYSDPIQYKRWQLKRFRGVTALRLHRALNLRRSYQSATEDPSLLSGGQGTCKCWVNVCNWQMLLCSSQTRSHSTHPDVQPVRLSRSVCFPPFIALTLLREYNTSFALRPTMKAVEPQLDMCGHGNVWNIGREEMRVMLSLVIL